MNSARALVVRLWVARAILLFGTVLYFEIGRRFLLDPAATIARFSIALPQPSSLTTVRAIMGAFFLGLSANCLYGLIQRKRMVGSLWVMVTFIFFVLCGRTLGIQIDGADAINLSELRNETTGFALYAFALIIAPRQSAATSPAA